MFRNITGVHDAIVHRLSETSLSNENKQCQLIKDIQSDDIAQTYASLKHQWLHQRDKLIERLKILEKQNALPNEIQHIKSLIECLKELIDHGEMTKTCQILIDDMNKNIHLLPESYLLPRKPLGDKMIRLPRHDPNAKTNIADPSEDVPLDTTVPVRLSNEKLSNQIVHHFNSKEQQKNSIYDIDETTASRASTENITSGIQFYVIAEQFRPSADNKH